MEFDASGVHAALDQAAAEYNKMRRGHVSNEAERFEASLATLRMIVDQSVDMIPKNIELAKRDAVLREQPGLVYQQNPIYVPEKN